MLKNARSVAGDDRAVVRIGVVTRGTVASLAVSRSARGLSGRYPRWVPKTRPELLEHRRRFAVAVGRRLAAAREAAHLSQLAAGEALAIPQSQIAKLELGQRTLTFGEALDLADLYGVAVTEFDARGDLELIRSGGEGGSQ